MFDLDDAPWGLLRAAPGRKIIAVNATLAQWLGYPRDQLIGRRFTDFFSAGGRIHFETHVAALLHVDGSVTELAVDLVTAAGTRLPVLITADVKLAQDGTGGVRMVVLDAKNRRSYERELLAERRRAQQSQQRAETLANTLRSSLLPPTLPVPPGMAAAALYHPADDDVTGDFYDLFPLTESTWGFFLGDVSGKGADAAALTSLTRYTLRGAAVVDKDPAVMLQTLNAVFFNSPNAPAATFATVIVGTLSISGDRVSVHLASGGHPYPLLLRAQGQVDEVLLTGGQAVGLIPAPRFAVRTLDLTPGDTLLFYTDGLTEARIGEHPRRYDDHGALLNFVRRNAPAGPVDIVAALDGLLTELGSGVQDDVALLALGMPGAGQRPR